jgi:sialic acid synthase SpsE
MIHTAWGAGCDDIVLLKCTSTYPATPENSNILTIPYMRELFGCEVGLSDYTLGIGAAVVAVAVCCGGNEGWGNIYAGEPAVCPAGTGARPYVL